MIKAVIVGSTGYTGVELVRILSKHLKVKIIDFVSKNYVGKRYSEVYSHFRNIVDRTCEGLDIDRMSKSDVVF